MNHIPYQDAIRGCLFGGAVGDALGYPVEFISIDAIHRKYGDRGITAYEYNHRTGEALISDDTQMALFTANGLICCSIQKALENSNQSLRMYVAKAYMDWYKTQAPSTEESGSWLTNIPALYSRRAPGLTCLNALAPMRKAALTETDYIQKSVNDSKGCGGVMRIAPIAVQQTRDLLSLDWEAAQISAITHGHPLGYIPSAVLCHIINRVIYQGGDLSAIVEDSKAAIRELFPDDEHLSKMTDILDLAAALAQNDQPDVENIHLLGGGWVAEEALAIAVYCCLRYPNDFSACMVAAVNHNGDSDSTGAIAGNILGARLGYDAIEPKWKDKLELSDVILEIADDLWKSWQKENPTLPDDPDWLAKYKGC